MSTLRNPVSRDERVRAIHHDLELVAAKIGPVEDNLGAHAILRHCQAMVLGLADKDFRKMCVEVPVRIDGWMLDYWPEYPAEVFDDVYA